MKAYFTFTRKGLMAVLAAVLLVLLIGGRFYAVENIKQNGKTNKQRVDFIKSTGFTPQEECISTKEIVIPQEFGDVYNNYNKLQKDAGFDLTPYKGSKATVYTYNIEKPAGFDGNAVANVIVYNGRIVGGDVSSAQLNGYMLPLCKTEE